MAERAFLISCLFGALSIFCASANPAIIGVEFAKKAIDNLRGVREVDNDFNACVEQAAERCIGPLEESFGGNFDGSTVFATLRNNTIRHVCTPIMRFEKCVFNTMSSCGISMNDLPPRVRQGAIAIIYTIHYVCREHTDELEQEKSCWLDPNEDNPYSIPNAVMAGMTCRQPNGNNDPCQIRPYADCITTNLEQSCGEQTGELLRGYVSTIFGRMGCTSTESKRGFKLSKKSGLDKKGKIFGKLWKRFAN